MTKLRKGKLVSRLKSMQQQRVKTDASKRAQERTEQAQQLKGKSTASSSKSKKRGPTNAKSFFPYLATHTVLLIGEGNFSFAHSLAKRLGSAQNITATSFDTRPIALEKYHDAQSHLDALQEMGGEVLFGVDGTALDKVEELKGRSFSHIVFNFPHAGAGIKDQTKNILTNQVLMMGFFESSVSFLHKGTVPLERVRVKHIRGGPRTRHASDDESDSDSGGDAKPEPKAQPKRGKGKGKGRVQKREPESEVFEFEGVRAQVTYGSDLETLDVPEDGSADGGDDAAEAVAVKPGQIHVALKSGPPYSHWNIRQLAKDSGLMSRGSVVFDFSAFPGYEHRRTLGFKEGVSKDENREIKDKDPLIHMFVVKPVVSEEDGGKKKEEADAKEQAQEQEKERTPGMGKKNRIRNKRTLGVNSESFDTGMAKAKRQR
ncbi:hypothetical protein LPJ66_002734 [Kickxella alabastrina]|uniref:Uncharacterized protein n=1 Tax=Kickxella alabastrina TaxID=61397 RepID=A0ACC1IPL8_9FUNG|nr:hypothetical protein LPJ66_002734 [Kickxella alabastrina]